MTREQLQNPTLNTENFTHINIDITFALKSWTLNTALGTQWVILYLVATLVTIYGYKELRLPG